MLELAFPWALALLPLPALVLWLAPARREVVQAVRIPFFEGAERRARQGRRRRRPPPLAAADGLRLAALGARPSHPRPPGMGRRPDRAQRARPRRHARGRHLRLDADPRLHRRGRRPRQPPRRGEVRPRRLHRRPPRRPHRPRRLRQRALRPRPVHPRHAAARSLLDTLAAGHGRPEHHARRRHRAFHPLLRGVEGRGAHPHPPLRRHRHRQPHGARPRPPTSRSRTASPSTPSPSATPTPPPTPTRSTSPTLQAIAAATGGSFNRAEDATGLAAIYAEIDAAGARQGATTSWRPRTPLAALPAAAFALVVLLAYAATLAAARLRRREAPA